MTKPVKSEQYYRVCKSLYDSYAFRTLSHKALALLHHMLIQFNGGNNGNISATLSIMKSFGWSSSATLSSAIKELLEHGLLKKTRQGGMGAMKQCSLYAFTHLPVSENMRKGVKSGNATHEYRTYSGHTSSKLNLPGGKIAVICSTDGSPISKALIRNLNCADLEYESGSPDTDSDFVLWGSETIQNMNKRQLHQTH
jgi:hypothetical protein